MLSLWANWLQLNSQLNSWSVSYDLYCKMHNWWWYTSSINCRDYEKQKNRERQVWDQGFDLSKGPECKNCVYKRWDTTQKEIEKKGQTLEILNSLFAKYKSPVCHIILGHTGIGATFRSTMFNSLYLFTCKLYGKFQKGILITHADSANQKQW